MTPNRSYKSKRKLDSHHYRILRTIHNDRDCKIPRKDLDELSNRVNPSQGAQYITASTAITLVKNNDTPMGRKLKEKIYVNDRYPGKVKFINTTKTKIGEQELSNRQSLYLCVQLIVTGLGFKKSIFVLHVNCIR